MDATERLASLVVARRVQLGHKRRPSFAEAAGISLRTLGDLETGRRGNFEPATIAAIENALQWTTGSIARILDGGEPGLTQHVTVHETVQLNGSATAHVTPAAQAASERDEALIRVMRSDLDDDTKTRIVQMLIAEKREAEKQRLKRAEQLIHLFEERA